MTMNKQILSVNYAGLKEEILKEVNRLSCNQAEGLGMYFHQFTHRFGTHFVQSLIDYSFGKMVFETRTWKNIDPIIFQSVMENSQFLAINDNMYSDKVSYFENEKYFDYSTNNGNTINQTHLENEFLAEIVTAFPYVLVDARAAQFVKNAIAHLSTVVIARSFNQNTSAQILLNQFQGNYVEIYFNKMRPDCYTVLLNRDMYHYINLVANKEQEFTALHYIPNPDNPRKYTFA